MEPILRCQDIHKSFSLGSGTSSLLQVLKGVTLDVQRGEILTIIGASGSGKSTLLHILGGLDSPSSGNVQWEGNNIAEYRDEQLAKTRSTFVGFVFQFHHLLQEFTALENIMIPLMIQGVPKRQLTERAQELLIKVGLIDRAHHKPTELSGGEQQRVAVARALANRPKVVLADEPTGNLDSANSEQLFKLFHDLHDSEGQTFVIVTHNESFTRQSERTFKMMDGTLHHIGK